jgi:L-ascorbate metabolism protein UlaG (beta-lactamase superfamily)
MGPEEAAKAGAACGAEIIVPIHWGTPSEDPKDADKIATSFGGKVRILERKA